jgi:peptidylprolyl isomerase
MATVDRPTSQRGSSRPRVRPGSSGKGESSRRKTIGTALSAPSIEGSASRVITAAEMDDDPDTYRRRIKEIDDRRYREWNNYQIAQRKPDDQARAPNLVFFDLSIGDAAPARVVVELFDDTPVTAENFRTLLLGEKGIDAASGIKLDYIDTACWRIIPNLGCFMGELAPGVSMASDGSVFNDENFAHRHSGRGTLSMATRGPHMNGSTFFIAFDKAPNMDFQQVVFGRVIEGIHVLDIIESVPISRNGTPKTLIAMSFCGALTGKAPIRSMPPDAPVLTSEPASPKTAMD